VSYVSEIDDKNNELMLREISDVIPANTGVIIYADKGDYVLPFSANSGNAVEGNMLEGVNVATGVTELKEMGGYGYILTLGRGKNSGLINFYNYTGKSLAAHKCYLGIKKGSEVKEYTLSFERDDPETMVESITSDMSGADNAIIYDLKGRRIAHPRKGICIINGKKILVK